MTAARRRLRPEAGARPAPGEVAVALVAMAAVAAAGRKGLYASPDSVFYVGTARSLLDGAGFRPPEGLQPLGHFPPLFTLAIAAVGRLGIDPLDAAGLVNLVALGATVMVAAGAVRARTGSAGAGLAAAVLTASAVDVLTLSAAALSEMLFVALAAGGLVALAAHLDRPRPPTLLTAAGLVALAVLTRYVGVALVAAGAGVILWRARRASPAPRPPLGDAAVFAGVALAPVVAWVAWAGRAGGGDRELSLHLPGAGYLGQAVRPLARWVVPWPGPPAGAALAVALAGAGLVAARRQRSRAPVATAAPAATAATTTTGAAAGPATPLGALPALLGAFAAAYLGLLGVNRALVDATGRLDARFLLPLHVVAIMAVVPAVHRMWGRRAVAVGAGALVAAHAVAGVSWTVGGLTDAGVGRRGYTAEAWRRSEVVARVAAAGTGRPVYSNGFDALFLLTGRTVRPVPAERQPIADRANPRFDEQLEAMRSELERDDGLVAYFDAATARRSFLPTRRELVDLLGLELVAEDEVGALYRLPRRPR